MEDSYIIAKHNGFLAGVWKLPNSCSNSPYDVVHWICGTYKIKDIRLVSCLDKEANDFLENHNDAKVREIQEKIDSICMRETLVKKGCSPDSFTGSVSPPREPLVIDDYYLEIVVKDGFGAEREPKRYYVGELPLHCVDQFLEACQMNSSIWNCLRMGFVKSSNEPKEAISFDLFRYLAIPQNERCTISRSLDYISAYEKQSGKDAQNQIEAIRRKLMDCPPPVKSGCDIFQQVREDLTNRKLDEILDAVRNNRNEDVFRSFKEGLKADLGLDYSRWFFNKMLHYSYPSIWKLENPESELPEDPEEKKNELNPIYASISKARKSKKK